MPFRSGWLRVCHSSLGIAEQTLIALRSSLEVVGMRACSGYGLATVHTAYACWIICV